MFENEGVNIYGSKEMSFSKFCECFLELVRAEVETGITVQLQRVVKNNGIERAAIVVKEENSNIAPSIYLETFFEEYRGGVQLDLLVTKFLEISRENRYGGNFDVSFFTNFEMAKERIVPRLVNYEKNQEILKKRPHRRWMDLAIVYTCLVNEDTGCMSNIAIYTEHLKYWGITEEKLYQTAMENAPLRMPVWIKNMAELVKGMIPVMVTDICSVPMYVISNQARCHGAITLMYQGVIRRLSDMLGQDLYILPSSVHELIVLPGLGDNEEEALLEMVRAVNASEVAAEEILSDNIYHYIREKDEITFVF